MRNLAVTPVTGSFEKHNFQYTIVTINNLKIVFPGQPCDTEGRHS